MNIPCRSCNNLSSCLTWIIDEGNKWYEEDSSAFTLYEGEVLQEYGYRMSDESILSLTFDHFKESIIETFKEKCLDFADYISKEHIPEGPEEYGWEERIYHIHSFFKEYYPVHTIGFELLSGTYSGEWIEHYNDENPKHNRKQII